MGRRKQFTAAYERVFALSEIAAMSRMTNAKGYVVCRVEEGWHELEHRLLATAMIGRPLRRGERIRHANDVRDDNRLENLVPLSVEGEPLADPDVLERLEGALAEVARLRERLAVLEEPAGAGGVRPGVESPARA